MSNKYEILDVIETLKIYTISFERESTILPLIGKVIKYGMGSLGFQHIIKNHSFASRHQNQRSPIIKK